MITDGGNLLYDCHDVPADADPATLAIRLRLAAGVPLACGLSRRGKRRVGRFDLVPFREQSWRPNDSIEARDRTVVGRGAIAQIEQHLVEVTPSQPSGGS